MTVPELSLIPPARLAVLLSTRRREAQLDISDIAARSGNRLTPKFLAEVEAGKHLLDDVAVIDLARAYELGPQSVPQRAKLVVDLNDKTIVMGGKHVLPASTEAEVLERYVALLYVLRGEKPGRELPLRADDVRVLATCFGRTTESVREQLIWLMTSQEVKDRHRGLASRVLLGTVGVLVGLTTFGSLIITAGDAGADDVADDGPAASALIADFDANDGAGLDLDPEPEPEPRPGLEPEPVLEPEPESESLSDGDTGDPAGYPRIDSGGKDLRASATGVDTDLKDVSSGPQDAGPDKVDKRAVSQSGGDADAAAEPVAAPAPQPEPEPGPGPELDPEADPEPPGPPTGSDITMGHVAEYVGMDFAQLVPSWEIELHGENPSYEGLTFSHENRIEIYVNPGASVEYVSMIVAHEVGHAVDIDQMNGATRAEWREMRGISQWWPESGMNDFSTGAGDFAEAVASYLVGSDSHSDFGNFTADQLAFIGNYING